MLFITISKELDIYPKNPKMLPTNANMILKMITPMTLQHCNAVEEKLVHRHKRTIRYLICGL